MGEVLLKCLGVGDGWPCADRNHSSYLYRFGKTRVLIDCGENVAGTLKAAHIGPDAIDGVVLSHLHSDHFGGLFMLLQGFWLGPRRKHLKIHLPQDGIQPIRSMLEAGMIFDELLAYRPSFEALNAGATFKVGSVRITPFPTTHLETLRQSHQKEHPLRFEAFSFLLESGKVRIAHSADLGAPEDLEPLLTKPLDLLVCELAHFTPESLFSYLRGRKIKRIVFMHLSDRLWRNRAVLSKLARKSLGGIPFSFARDGEEFSV